jgi:hypothetical protein
MLKERKECCFNFVFEFPLLSLNTFLFQFLAFFNTFPAMVGFCVVWGLICGVYYSMCQTIVIQFLGVRSFRLTFGLIQLFSGASVGAAYPIIGW